MAMLTTLLAHFLVIGSLSIATADCSPDGSVAEPKNRGSSVAPSIAALIRLAESCNRYEQWMALAEASLKQGAQEDAARAYDNAYQMAEDPKLQAAALAGYAKLLYGVGQKQRALSYAYQARNLDPASDELRALAEKIGSAADKLNEEDITRGLSDLALQPLRLREDNLAGSAGTGAGEQRPNSINIPLHFEYNSPKLDPASRSNVFTLARTLASRFSNSEIEFVGHADRRGDESYNQRLSLDRARSVYEQVVAIAPELRYRITTRGLGESRPLSMGGEESDHRINRRLEVIVR